MHTSFAIMVHQNGEPPRPLTLLLLICHATTYGLFSWFGGAMRARRFALRQCWLSAPGHAHSRRMLQVAWLVELVATFLTGWNGEWIVRVGVVWMETYGTLCVLLRVEHARKRPPRTKRIVCASTLYCYVRWCSARRSWHDCFVRNECPVSNCMPSQ